MKTPRETLVKLYNAATWHKGAHRYQFTSEMMEEIEATLFPKALPLNDTGRHRDGSYCADRSKCRRAHLLAGLQRV